MSNTNKDEVVAPIDAPDNKETFMEKMKALFPNAKEAELTAAWDKHSSKTLTDRIVETMNSYGESLVKEMEVKFQEQLKAKMAEAEKAMEQGIRKGLGLDKDPIAKLSDVEAIVRKIQLEQADLTKKTKTQTGGTSPEGNVKTEDKADLAKRLDSDLKTRRPF